MTGSTPTERYIRSFVEVARQQLRGRTWEEIEPALAVSWEELREPQTPSWREVAAQILCRCLDSGGGDGRAA